MRAESFGSHKVDASAKSLFKQVCKIQEASIGLLTRAKLDQHVDIAAASSLVSDNRAEQREAADTKRQDPVPNPLDAFGHLLPGQCLGHASAV